MYFLLFLLTSLSISTYVPPTTTMPPLTLEVPPLLTLEPLCPPCQISSCQPPVYQMVGNNNFSYSICLDDIRIVNQQSPTCPNNFICINNSTDIKCENNQLIINPPETNLVLDPKCNDDLMSFEIPLSNVLESQKNKFLEVGVGQNHLTDRVVIPLGS
jgi:hypothetical protein